MPFNFADGEPDTLAGAVDFLRAGLNPDELNYIRHNSSASVHHGVGMALRNGWRLWRTESKLAIHFRETYGLGHADDMSAIILGQLWAQVLGEDYSADLEAKRLRKFWTDQHVDPLTLGMLMSVSDEKRDWRNRFLQSLRILLKLEEPSHDATA